MMPQEESPPTEVERASGFAQLGGFEQFNSTLETDASQDALLRQRLLAKGRGGGAVRRNATGETSARAAGAIDRRPLRERVLFHIEVEPSTPERILVKLRAEGVRTVLTSVRPRCSELARLGLVKDSGARGRAEGGMQAIIWRATTPAERRAWLELHTETEGSNV